MDQEKIGNLIKEIRQKNNLTQKEFALKYNVTYQAVSKWENNKNIPDIALLKKISEDFNIDINDLLNGNNKKKKNNKIIIIIIILIIIIFGIFLYFYLSKQKEFEFKSLTTSCSSFTIKGAIAYNKNKSSIHISNIEYCGGVDNEIYKSIEYSLYESHNNSNILISNKASTVNTTLEKYLENLEFIVDYDRTCSIYSHDSLYLEIKATNKENKIIAYDIPLVLKENCN